MPLNFSERALTSSQIKGNPKRLRPYPPRSEYRRRKYVSPDSLLIECSFVNRGVKQLSDATSTICSWLFDRFAIIISNDDLKVKVPLGSILSQDEDELENESAFLFCKYQVSESLDDAVREERAHMIALYDNITGDYWPETWTKVLLRNQGLSSRS